MNPYEDNIEQIWLGAKTKRYHTDPLMSNVLQSNAEHQHGVVQLALFLEPDLSREAILYAVNHDGAEYVVGDLPQPLKREYPEFDKSHKEIEHHYMTKLGLNYVITEREYKIIKLADSLDAIMLVALYYPHILDRLDWKEHIRNTLDKAYMIDSKVYTKVSRLVSYDQQKYKQF